MLLDLGFPVLALALVVALVGIVLAMIGARRDDLALVASARNAVLAVAALVLLAAVLLWIALLTDQFQFEYVASHVERDLSPFYKFSADRKSVV